MKNKGNVILAFLLCACLIVAVGYAALSESLNINGSTSYAYNGGLLDHEVKFTGYRNLAHCNVSLSQTGTIATVSVAFTKADADINGICTATVTFIITNGLEEDIVFTNPGNIFCNDDAFDVTTDWTENRVVASGTETEITVTVTADTKALNADHTGTFVIQLPAASVAP